MLIFKKKKNFLEKNKLFQKKIKTEIKKIYNLNLFTKQDLNSTQTEDILLRGKKRPFVRKESIGNTGWHKCVIDVDLTLIFKSRLV